MSVLNALTYIITSDYVRLNLQNCCYSVHIFDWCLSRFICSSQRKLPTSHELLTNFIRNGWTKVTSPWVVIELKTLVVIGTDCISTLYHLNWLLKTFTKINCWFFFFLEIFIWLLKTFIKINCWFFSLILEICLSAIYWQWGGDPY
jgi:hypothetical protein